jgi:nicotinate-nucleotide pyrophosphorylase
MDEIQRNIIRQGKRSSVTRLFRGNDSEAVATWRLEFNKILRVFNVRSVTSAWSLLTSHFQTELVVDTRPTVSGTRHDVANIHTTASDAHHDTPDADNIVPDVRHDVSSTHPIVPEVWSDIANTRTTAPDIRRDKSKSREDAGGRNQAVSITHTLTVTEWPLTIV